MRLLPSDPDVETIVSRIKKGDIDLQPDFQRGEVWSVTKKQRLIDSVLRNWHIPPIHLIQLEDSSKQQVLDGQQRLAAIRDFVEDKIAVNGQIPPLDKQIEALDGLTYKELPPEWKRKFDQFTIRVFRITDYHPEEPGELFFRLNQLTNLTAAEQRNAFYGPARQQVKDLVEKLGELGIDKDFIGFSNSRMAYDDVVARVCETIETGTFAEKLTAGSLTNRYRSSTPFSSKTINNCVEAIELLGGAKSYVSYPVRFNKATLYSWLVFFVEARNVDVKPSLAGNFLAFFEMQRTTADTDFGTLRVGTSKMTPAFLAHMFAVYNDRSAARVADVSSVILRDAILWILYLAFLSESKEPLPLFHPRVNTILLNAKSDLTRETGDKFLNTITNPQVWGPLP